jgi:phage tail protein X
MRNEYRTGPIYRAGLIVSGGMCAGLGIAILVSQALHRIPEAQLLPVSVSTPPAAALGFAACGLALMGIGLWFPRITSVLAMVTLSMVVALVAERAFGAGPRVEALVAANLGLGDWSGVAPNTVAVLLFATAALLLRHTYQWFENRLGVIAVLGSIIFAIGVASCMGYITGVPTYVWQSRAPMSFLSAICSCVLGLGIIMSACRYSELAESGMPRWSNLVVGAGALAINLTTAVAYICRDGQTWKQAEVIGLMPMMIVCGLLAALAARQASRQGASV